MGIFKSERERESLWEMQDIWIDLKSLRSSELLRSLNSCDHLYKFRIANLHERNLFELHELNLTKSTQTAVNIEMTYLLECNHNQCLLCVRSIGGRCFNLLRSIWQLCWSIKVVDYSLQVILKVLWLSVWFMVSWYKSMFFCQRTPLESFGIIWILWNPPKPFWKSAKSVSPKRSHH